MKTPHHFLPEDEFNAKLAANVHPADWVNPEPSEKYNLVVIGAGTAGLVTAAGAAGLGAKVALIERQFMGGDCLNVGCVPSKAIISAARAAAAVSNTGKLEEFGVHVPVGTEIDFSKVMERMRKLRSDISPHDSVKRFAALGIDVFLGQGRFVDSSTIAVGDAKLQFAKAVICTGARASAPPIDGLDTVPYLTNETLFSLTELPKRLGIIGAGPIGCEMAQAFARLGSEVYLVESAPGILSKEDPDAADIVKNQLIHDGVKILCCGKGLSLSPGSDSGVRLSVQSEGNGYDVTVDELLVAVGRAPNVEGLELEKVGVEYTKKGVTINDNFRTTNKRIYAAGDICSSYQFTHAADFMARSVIRNTLFFGRAKHSSLVIPWATYTSPEVAQVGLNLSEAKRQHIEIDTFTQPMSGVDRAILEGDTDGFVRVHVKKGTDKIVGATIVASNAGDMIGSFSIAMTQGIGLGSIANCIHPYPTQGEAIRKVGDLYNKTRLTPKVASIMKRIIDWQR
jgi:pyruvate/2-oxoglutarate dehydrogenase complex dihydrolipoamide dehydrogenase (E3) component